MSLSRSISSRLTRLSAEKINWPWPRQVYAPIIEFVSRADAVFIDILFTEPSSYGEEDDRILGDAVSKASNVYLPFFLSMNEKPLGGDDLAYLKRFAMPGDVPLSASYRSAVTPIDQLRDGVRGSGNVAISPDSDGVYRRVPVSFKLMDMTLPSLIFSSFSHTENCKVESGRLMLGTRYVPLTNGKLLLRFPRGKNAYRTIPAIDILEAYRTGKNAGGHNYAGSFQRKGRFSRDDRSGPFRSQGNTDHVRVNRCPRKCHDVRKSRIRDLHAPGLARPIVLAFMLLISCLHRILRDQLSYDTQKSLRLRRDLSHRHRHRCSVFSHQYYLPTTYLMVTVIVSFLLSVAFSYAVEGRERQFIKRTFSQYMDKTIVDYVLQNPELVKPGGKKARLSRCCSRT